MSLLLPIARLQEGGLIGVDGSSASFIPDHTLSLLLVRVWLMARHEWQGGGGL